MCKRTTTTSATATTTWCWFLMPEWKGVLDAQTERDRWPQGHIRNSKCPREEKLARASQGINLSQGQKKKKNLPGAPWWVEMHSWWVRWRWVKMHFGFVTRLTLSILLTVHSIGSPMISCQYKGYLASQAQLAPKRFITQTCAKMLCWNAYTGRVVCQDYDRAWYPSLVGGASEVETNMRKTVGIDTTETWVVSHS